MIDLSGFRDAEIARKLIGRLEKIATKPVKFMEVCGTHTVSIAKHGLRDIMPETLTLLRPAAAGAILHRVRASSLTISRA